MDDVMLWVEKYRPSKISDCVLTDDLKTTFQTFVNEGHIPNLLLSGGPGVGKTTVAKAMLEELGATYMMINGSENQVLMYSETKSRTLQVLSLWMVIVSS